jgi:hypothetical protein
LQNQREFALRGALRGGYGGEGSVNQVPIMDNKEPYDSSLVEETVEEI